MYAQKIEGDGWVGEKLDPAKIDKMNGLPIPNSLALGHA